VTFPLGRELHLRAQQLLEILQGFEAVLKQCPARLGVHPERRE